MGAETATQALLLAEVGRRRIALPADRVAGVLLLLPLWRPPTLPPALAGFAAVAGRALPVLAAARLLGEAEGDAPGLYAHIVRLAGAEETGLLVDRVADLVRVDPARRLPVDPADTLGGCTVAMIGLAEGAVHLLAPDRLLAAGEQAALAALRAEADRRLADWAVPA